MIQVLYFARYREMLGADSEMLDLDTENFSVNQLKLRLAARGEQWQSVFGGEHKVLAAVNQQMADVDAVIRDGDEIAFFPPVSGG